MLFVAESDFYHISFFSQRNINVCASYNNSKLAYILVILILPKHLSLSFPWCLSLLSFLACESFTFTRSHSI